MRFLVVGATGMAGHTISTYLKEKDHVVDTFSRIPTKLGHKNFVGEATSFSGMDIIVAQGRYDAIINCIGILNKKAEEDIKNAILVNSFLPHYLADIANSYGAKLVHLSTDCVFSGKSGAYREEDFPDGRLYYDRTKALGEVVDSKNITFRTSIIGPDMKKNGIGIFNWFMNQTDNPLGYKEAIWSGITTLTLAKAIECVADKEITGIYHLVNNDVISKYELLKLFNKYFCNNRVNIIPFENIRIDKSLINNRGDFDFTVPSYEEMIREMKLWVDNHKEMYPHYFR